MLPLHSALGLAALTLAFQDLDRPAPAAAVFNALMVDTDQSVSLVLELAVADLDRDGHQDVITATASADTQVSVLLGDGRGGLTLWDTQTDPVPFGGSVQPAEIAVLDVDGDGLLDVVTSGTERGPWGHGEQGLLQVFAGDGLGRLEPPYPVHLPNVPREVKVADMDGDGLPDLITRADNLVLVLLRLPGGGFAPPAITPAVSVGTASHLEVGDVDGDLAPDVLTVAGLRVRLLRNAGDGTLLPPEKIEPSFRTSAIALADFDLDGRLDFARWWHGVGDDPPETSFHVGDGLGGFRPVDRLRLGHSSRLRVADLDGDGQAELVTVLAGGLHRLFLRGGAEVVEGPLGGVVWNNVLADLDGDGADDLIAYRESDQHRSHVVVSLSAGDGTLRDVVVSDAGFGGELTALPDLDRDGHADALGRSHDGSRIWVAPGLGQGRFGPARQLRSPTGGGGPIAGDFDGDGLEDLAVLDGTPFSVSLMIGRGDLTFSAGETLTLATLWTSSLVRVGAAVGDVDGDGRAELVLDAPGRGAVGLLGERGGRFVVEGWLATPESVGLWTLRDVDGNGVADVVYLRHEPTVGSSLWAFGWNASGGWGPVQKLLDLPVPWVPGQSWGTQMIWSPNASWLQVADLDGDGHEEVLAQRAVEFTHPAQHFNVSEVATWKGLPGGTWTPPVEWRINSRLGLRQPVDLDGDGVREVVFGLGGYVPCTGVWRPTGGFLEPRPERYGFSIEGLEDLDGDGHADAVSVENGLLITYLNRSRGRR